MSTPRTPENNVDDPKIARQIVSDSKGVMEKIATDISTVRPKNPSDPSDTQGGRIYHKYGRIHLREVIKRIDEQVDKILTIRQGLEFPDKQQLMKDLYASLSVIGKRYGGSARKTAVDIEVSQAIAKLDNWKQAPAPAPATKPATYPVAQQPPGTLPIPPQAPPLVQSSVPVQEKESKKQLELLIKYKNEQSHSQPYPHKEKPKQSPIEQQTNQTESPKKPPPQ